MRGMRVGYSLVHSTRSTSNETNVSKPSINPQPRATLAIADKNALIQSPQTPTKRGIIMPPSEKQQQYHTRPLLSSAAKQSHKTPLTPRIAGTTPITPSIRRTPRPESNGTPFTSQKDEYSNITPRSGSRRARIESPKTTPTGTPTPTAPPRGLGIGGIHHEEAKRPSVTFAPASEFTNQKNQSQQNADSKFFLASDAKASIQPLQQKPSLQAKGPTFFYANGDSIPPAIKSSSSAVGSNTGEDRPSSMFFHANGAPDIPYSLHSPSSNVSTSHIASPRLAASRTHSPQQRPPSPLKSDSHSSVLSTRSTPALPSLPRPNISTARGQSSQNVIALRRVSNESRAHGRSASVGSFEVTPPGRKYSGNPAEGLPVTPSNFSSVVTISTPEGRQEEKDEHQDPREHELGSPIRAGASLDQMNELAAEARRDRKVLDLEITNSSLEAINRTLERQMRKQNAELRRYRRLSRSGRLSLANPISTGEYSVMAGMDVTDLSDMSEGEEEENEDREDNTSEEESMDDGSLSPGAMAESDARHRQRDEKRLRLDLSKHQQLISASQLMNSSLRRCLAWTEELIAEGKKALDYKVRPSDVNLGGRVLTSEDIETNESEGLSEIGARLVREARQKRAASLSPSASSFGGSNKGDSWSDKADRDSGIELPNNYRPDPSSPYNNTTMDHPPP